jgi:hypothetical protein
VPLEDSNGQLVTLVLGGQSTLRLTDGGANLNFLVLTPAVSLQGAVIGGNLDLQFGTETGFHYTVLYKSQLSDAIWTVLSTVVGDGTVKTIADPVTAGAGRFYKLEVH